MQWIKNAKYKFEGSATCELVPQINYFRCCRDSGDNFKY